MALKVAPEKVDKGNIKQLLSSTDTFLFDCDGVLYRGMSAIEGTADVVNKLVSMGKKVMYITNNSSKSREQVANKLSSFSFPATPSSIVSSGYVTACYLREVREGASVFVLGDTGLQQELESQGLKVVLPQENFTADTVGGKLQEYHKRPEVSVVVLGLEENVNYLKVAQCMSYLYHTDLLFVATNRDSSYPAANGKVFPGCGSIVAMVETAAGRSIDMECGKPGHMMADVIKKQHTIDFSRTVMVGDRLDTDIKFGQQNGMKTMLVLTGVSTQQTLNNLSSNNTPPSMPHFYLPSLADLKDLI